MRFGNSQEERTFLAEESHPFPGNRTPAECAALGPINPQNHNLVKGRQGVPDKTHPDKLIFAYPEYGDDIFQAGPTVESLTAHMKDWEAALANLESGGVSVAPYDYAVVPSVLRAYNAVDTQLWASLIRVDSVP